MFNSLTRSYFLSVLLSSLLVSVFLISNAFAAEKLEFKPDYNGGKAFSHNIKGCVPGTFIVFNPICLNIIKAGVDMTNQMKESQGNALSQAEVDQGILGCQVTYQIIGKEGDKCRYQVLDSMSKTNSNCTVSVEELSSMAENSNKIYGGASNMEASTSIPPIGTLRCSPVPMPK